MRESIIVAAAMAAMLIAPTRGDAPATDTHATIATAKKTILDHYVLLSVAIAEWC